jgi:SAM-dependent methyltransferase
VLELACGTGRITLPLAREGFAVVGLDNEPEMLRRAEQLRGGAGSETRQRLSYVNADMMTWRSDTPFDLILIPCASLSHIHELDDQISLFRQCYQNLRPGGRFVVELSMPNMAAFVDSFHIPPRALVEIDIDTTDESDGTRLVRRKTITYSSHNQLAKMRFLYEKFKDGRAVENYIDDLVSHVFFPRELELLFIHTGFMVERTLGDYRGRALNAQSRLMIMVGIKS